MSKPWPWMTLACLCAAGILVQAQTGGITPADDRKEPKTLTKIVGPDPTPKPASDALDDGTSLQTETQYRPSAAGAIKDEPSAIKTKTLDRTIGGVHVQGFYAVPAKTTAKGAILILPEWWGVTPGVKTEAAWWAGEGYRVLAYDFYNDDKLPLNRGEAAAMMAQIRADKTMPRLKTALALLAAPMEKTTATLKVGVIGLGMGTAWALRLAAENTSMTAAAVYYGEPVKDPETLKKIHAPLLGLFVEHDGLVTPEKLNAFQKAMAEAKTPLQIVTSPTHPGFLTNPTDDTDKGEIDKAHRATQDFFGKFLTK